MTHHRTRCAVVAALLVLGLSAGCSSGRPPVPAQPSVSVPPIPGVGMSGAGRFRADPCAAVTVEQLTALGFTGGERSRDGNRCVTTFGAVAKVSTSNLGDSLQILYQEHTLGHDTGNHWEPITVETIYPAVIVAIDENVPSKQADGPRGCTLALAADNSTLVHISAATADQPEAGPWQHDPCGAAQKIAALVVANLTA
ncbi:DUF3558 domain-containing protein [Amycolatopsis sp. NBC_01307]|uniref:DUF3558 family protein n=1 Tax=Amycolatopsis sp. NBC_01307 TaxID=2903561 RepID=UPI002E14B3EA|nr:DUF3558 domain-containing protein [Amycolatopsis sp. NBC_01307]